eukprot:6785883-Alexandrium_andersonii.AAC.1
MMCSCYCETQDKNTSSTHRTMQRTRRPGPWGWDEAGWEHALHNADSTGSGRTGQAAQVHACS